MTAPHQTPEFQNSATWTVAVTFTVAGGARSRTAWRHAQRVAEQVTSAATRLRRVVDVRAVAGPADPDGQWVLTPERLRFAAANSGHGTYLEPDKLDRYLDPEYERALASLAEANDRYRRHREADRDRRREVGCANAWRESVGTPRSCECAYCEPLEHLETLRQDAVGGLGCWPARCLCGAPVHAAGGRCASHRGVELAALEDDPPALREFVEELTATRARDRHRSEEHRVDRRPDRPGPELGR